MLTAKNKYHTRNKYHSEFESQIIEFARHLGLHNEQTTYHRCMSRKAQNMLKQMNSNEYALSLRHQPDGIFINDNYELCFGWDAKTTSGGYGNLQLEANALAIHRLSRHPILFIWRNLAEELEGCFWSDDILDIEVIRMPERWQETRSYEFFKDLYRRAFGSNVIIKNITNTPSGSNTPMIAISGQCRDLMPSWQSVLRNIVQSAQIQWL